MLGGHFCWHQDTQQPGYSSRDCHPKNRLQNFFLRRTNSCVCRKEPAGDPARRLVFFALLVVRLTPGVTGNHTRGQKANELTPGHKRTARHRCCPHFPSYATSLPLRKALPLRSRASQSSCGAELGRRASRLPYLPAIFCPTAMWMVTCILWSRPRETSTTRRRFRARE